MRASSSKPNPKTSGTIGRHWPCISERAIIQDANFIVHLRRRRSCIKINKQRQKSYTSSCITHTSCWFGLAVWPRQYRSSDSGQTPHHNTAVGRHSYKRIIWRRQMDTSDTVGEHNDSYNIFSKQFVSFFWVVISFQHVPENLSPHRPARRKSHFIAQEWWREKIASRMPTWTITQYFHGNIKLEATASVKPCVSKILKESAKRRLESEAPDNWRLRMKLRATGFDRNIC